MGIAEPSPPILKLPHGHTPLLSTDGINNSVWKRMLEKCFVTRPDIDYQAKIQELISINASSDNLNFEARLKGGKSHLVGIPHTAPSLLRSFLYENGLPDKNEFFSWVFAEMKGNVYLASKDGYNHEWSKNLGLLVNKWNSHFPDNPFIPQQ